MKYLLLIVLVLLVASSVLTAWAMPGAHSAVPVIRWVTDNNPARAKQIDLFQKWLAAGNGPAGELRLDVSNSDETKKIVQSVSGVAGDVMDVSSDQMPYFNAIGFLADVTTPAKERGYTPAKTFAALRPLLGVTDGEGVYHQLLFPCNVTTTLCIVNRDAFHQAGQPVPPARWTLDEFERRGLAYVQAANPPGRPRQNFFSVEPDVNVLRRSLGVGEFDETQTHCTLDDPRYADLLERLARWRRLHLIPTKADEASFTSAGAQYGGAAMDLFNRGHYAMLFSGRYLIIGFREMNIGRAARGEPPLDLTAVEPPNGGFPNVDINTRGAGVYAATKAFPLACAFQAFLASPAYNEQIIRDGDSLPPDPSLTHTDAYRHPPRDAQRGVFEQTEWDFHEPFATAAETIAVPRSSSPFLLNSVFEREDTRTHDLFLETGELTAAEAVNDEARRLNNEIQRSIAESPQLQQRYDALCKQQQAIDALKAAGKKVPAAMVIDPFRLAYGKANGTVE